EAPRQIQLLAHPNQPHRRTSKDPQAIYPNLIQPKEAPRWIHLTAHSTPARRRAKRSLPVLRTTLAFFFLSSPALLSFVCSHFLPGFSRSHLRHYQLCLPQSELRQNIGLNRRRGRDGSSSVRTDL